MNRWLTAIGIFVEFITVVSLAVAQRPVSKSPPGGGIASVRPGINEAFLDPELEVGEWVERFEVESREVFAARQSIVEAIGLMSGDRVADIGTGTGLFVEPFAQAVGPDGWVYALDIAPKFVARVGAIAEQKGLSNVTPVLTTQDAVVLPPSSVDVAFICDVYHHFEYPAASLASLYRSLRPGGQLVLIDFERIPGVSSDWTLGHVRAGKLTFRGEIETAGFRFAEEVDVAEFEENYFLRFEKPAAPDPSLAG